MSGIIEQTADLLDILLEKTKLREIEWEKVDSSFYRYRLGNNRYIEINKHPENEIRLCIERDPNFIWFHDSDFPMLQNKIRELFAEIRIKQEYTQKEEEQVIQDLAGITLNI